MSGINLGEVRIYFCVDDAFFVDRHNYSFDLLIFRFKIGLLNERKIILYSFVCILLLLFLIDSFLSRSQRGWLSPKVLCLMEMPK